MRLKTLLLIGLLAALLAMGVALEDKNPESDQQNWRLIRTVTSSDTALAADTKTWTAIKGTFIPVPKGWTWVSLTCVAYGDGDGAGDPSAGTFTLGVHGARQFCSSQVVCIADVAVGGLQLSHDPATGQAPGDPSSYRFAEGPYTITSEPWMTAVEASGTTDDVGLLTFSTHGLFGFWPEVTALAGVTSVSVYYTGGE